MVFSSFNRVWEKLIFLETENQDGKQRKWYDRNAPKVMPPKLTKTTKDFEVCFFYFIFHKVLFCCCLFLNVSSKNF